MTELKEMKKVEIMCLKRKILLFCIVSIPHFYIEAQNLQVLDQDKEEGISHVAVYNKTKTKAVLSDKAGFAKLDQFDLTDTLFLQHPAFNKMVYTKKELMEMKYHLYMLKNVLQLDELVLSVSRFEEKKEEIPMEMHVITSDDITILNPPTSADVLGNTGQVMIQKSQQGGGSPILRGFEANKVLLVVDGVRMNNAIYRSGHLHNVITIDNLVLDRVEVVCGPGAVIYGSDALGGVMHFITKNPKLPTNDSSVFSAVNGLVRYASANHEQTTHFNFNIGFKKLGLFTGITNSNYGDLRMGGVRNKTYPEFGMVKHYSSMGISGNDTMITNEDPNLQIPTGYSQVNLIQKVLYRPNDYIDIGANIQYSTTSNIPRFDKLNDMSGDTLKYAEWYYGPQRRLFASLTANINYTNSWFDKANWVFSYQKLEEDRINRKFNAPERFIRQENVDVLSANLSFFKTVDSARSFQYGVEASFNDVSSQAYSENVNDSSRSYATTRYPDGGSDMQSYGAYMAYKWELSPIFLLNAGVRYNQFKVRANFVDTSTYQLPFNEIDNGSSAFNGSMGLVCKAGNSLRVTLLLASGYRAPNVDDLGKVFAKDEYVTVPNNSLAPEKIHSGEAGILKTMWNNKVSIQLAGYYSILSDAIVRREFVLNGQDSLDYDGEQLKILANVNTGDAVIYGSSAVISTQFNKLPNIDGAITYTYGWDMEEDMPLSHIPPVFGRVALSKKFGKANGLKPIMVTVYSHFNGWKRLEQYGSESVDNLSEATPDGTPSWVTLNFIASYKLNIRQKHLEKTIMTDDFANEKALVFQFGIENILDHHYKCFSSGMSAPGRNIIVSLRASF